MTIRFICPTCRKSLSAPEEKAGAKSNCPQCGQRIQVPYPPVPKTVLGQLEIGTPKTVLGELVQDPPPPLAQLVPYSPPEPFDVEEMRGGPVPAPRRRSHAEPRDLEPHRGTAILIMGILALVVPLSLILGPIAWSWANEDLGRMRAGFMDPEGKGNTEAGKVCGMIATMIGLVGVGIVSMYFMCCGMFFAGLMGI